MREDISFQTSDGVTLRGWFYKPSSSSSTSTSSTTKLPCLVMAHGFSALKEMDLDAFAEAFVSALPLSCLVYDNRGFGASDAKGGSPRQEIIPSVQISDYQDAITHAQMREDVDGAKIGVWGSSYSGGHVIVVSLWCSISEQPVKSCLSRCCGGQGKMKSLRIGVAQMLWLLCG